MTDVRNMTAKVESDIQEIMGIVMSKMDGKTIAEMGVDDFQILKAVFNLVDSTAKLMSEYGRTIEDIDKKIDKLLGSGDQK